MASVSKDLIKLKDANLIDEKELWANGQIYKVFNLGMLFGALGGAASAMANKRLFSVKGNELIVSKIVNKIPVPDKRFTKDNIESIQVKSGLTKKLIIEEKGGKKIIYMIGINRQLIGQMIEILK